MIRSFTLLVLTTSVTTFALAQQSVRVRCRDCAPTAEGRAAAEARAAQDRDSVRARAFGAGGFNGDIERVAMQLLSIKQLQIEAQQGLQALTSGQVAEANRAQAEMMARRFRSQIDQAAKQVQVLRTQLAALCDRNTKPDGYMGITFSATMRADATGSGSEVFRFAENPTVETVEPGSPAERAGVSKGDEIILIGGQGVVGRDIVFTRLLRPGNRLPIRVRRDGDERDVLLLVGSRPPSLDNGCPFLDARIMAAFGDQVSITQSPVAAGGVVRATPIPSGALITRMPAAMAPEAPTTPRAVRGTVTVVSPAPMVPTVPLPAPTPAEARSSEPSVFVFSGAPSAPVVIAGATIIRTNADLRETFGVKSGVLVLDVARGTPAYNSGLKGGDIIVSAGRGAVTSPLSIQRAIENASESEIQLRIIRKKKQQSLTLRW
ncbi:MAG TPA: PDZ domain-containing protein [Gemmatimonadaceae bacterium]|nr:PDZ domain-containing protein [Gemmatimonadaceae bacterium]